MEFNNVDVMVGSAANVINALQDYNTVILKPNIVDNRNVLTQSMMNAKHTKYVIRWNYTLEGGTVTVPEDCIIEFAGGTIDNGVIVGNNTRLIYSKPIDEICKAERQGTWIYDTTVADEEDITSIEGHLKFKDRSATDGMGKVILRKNKSFASQVTEPNTIYVIQYDFTLDDDITVPENCILEFDGGSINGTCTITGQNTYFSRGKFVEVKFDGTWNVNTLFDTDFSYSNDNDLFHALTALSSDSVFNNIYIQGNYDVDIPSNEYTVFSILSNTKIHLTGTITVKGNRFPKYNVFRAESKTNITIDGGGSIIGDALLHDYTTIESAHEWGILISMVGCNNCIVENVNCSYATGDGIDFDSSSIDNKSKDCIIRYCTATYCRRFGIVILGAKDILISNCEVSHTNDFDSSYNVPACSSRGAIDLEAWRDDELTEDVIIEDCYFHDNKSYTDDLVVSRRGYNIRVIRTFGNLRIQPSTDNAPIYIDNCICPNMNCRQGDITVSNSKIGTIFVQSDLNRPLSLNVIASEMDATLGAPYISTLDNTHPSIIQHASTTDRNINVKFDNCIFKGGNTFISHTKIALKDTESYQICNSTIETTNDIIVGMVDYIGCIIKCNRFIFIISKKCVEFNQCTIIFSADSNSSSNALFVFEAKPIQSNAEGVVIVKMCRNLFRNVSNKKIEYILVTTDNSTAISNFSNRIIYFEDNIINIANTVGREIYIKTQFANRTGIIAYFGIDGRNVLRGYGTTAQRPLGPTTSDGVMSAKLCLEDKGFGYFDTDINKIIFAQTITSNDTNVRWVEADGALAGIKRVGTFAEKPTTGIYKGFRYFCTDKQTPEQAAISADLKGMDIIYKETDYTAPNNPILVWVDALGRVVS